jgi:hypothetical protein
MQIIRLAKLQYIRHTTHSITSQYMYAYAKRTGTVSQGTGTISQGT